MLRISWVTRGSDKASTHRQINLSCLPVDQDLYLSPGCLKLFSFSMMHLSRFPVNMRGGMGCCSA
nr:hypothetical protein Iba_chr08bCG0210 [Ipomoea batatas]GMD22907.1 hypothetical protein Iba_chr08bCG0220 [Ipomoea batatas]GMD95945.1 hypothetical protein Iba_scaffold422994CG0010 [Ipomoea batatas]GME09208.1 hypothetical protein Iba_scaffold8367CG0040 [Ipomoea batatas]GME15837.1 hypothetical protein Iba_scaffold16809CG0010 [Ipomoea batatas]